MSNNNNKSIEQDVHIGRKKRYFSFLTFVLILCIIELSFSAFQNINKNFHFNSKIKDLENKRNEEKSKNEQLKSELENFDSASTLESIARNNLKMAEKDEILIIINKSNEKVSSEEEAHLNFFTKNKKTAH